MERNKIFKKALFVINPIAGDLDKSALSHDIEHLCGQYELELSYFRTTGQQDERKLREQLEKEKPDVVVAVGGDGTVHLVGSVLLGQFPQPLAIIPRGSGNGLSKDLAIPQDPHQALAVLRHHTIRSIDTLRLNHLTCVHLADLGFNAHIVKQFSEEDTRGPGTYIKLALQQYLPYTPRTYQIETDNGHFEGEAFNITFTNANNYGSNATINPQGLLNDGAFEICIIEPFPKAAGVALLYRLFHDTIDQSVYSRVIRCKRATIYNPDHELLQIDGEPVKLGNKINVSILPRSLRVLLPYSPENLL